MILAVRGEREGGGREREREGERENREGEREGEREGGRGREREREKRGREREDQRGSKLMQNNIGNIFRIIMSTFNSLIQYPVTCVLFFKESYCFTQCQ